MGNITPSLLLFFFFALLVCPSLSTPQKVPISENNNVKIGGEAAVVAQLIANQIINNSATFLNWDYGCAIIFDALWEALGVFGGDYAGVLNKYLDTYETTSNYFGYEVLNNITIPWAAEVGDTVGLFPIAYLARNAYYTKVGNASYVNTTDLKLATSIGTQYVAPYPWRLPDGTYSRQSGWAGETGGNHTFVWADDSFMGTALLARLAILYEDSSYLDTIMNQQITYAAHLRDTIDGLFHHGYNGEDNHQSCCKWSRANGWLMMSHVEVLLAMQALNYDPSLMAQVQNVFVAHAQSAARAQSPDGRWYQVLNDSSTFLETSTTGMFLLCFITGVENGWLNKTEFDPVIQNAYNGLLETVQPNGAVTGICTGTGIGTSVSEYEDRPTPYLGSSPGLGSVLRAVTAFSRYSML